MPKIDVSVGELFDKLSILEIKKAKGLEVDIELDKLSSEYQQYNNALKDEENNISLNEFIKTPNNNNNVENNVNQRQKCYCKKKTFLISIGIMLSIYFLFVPLIAILSNNGV